MKWCLCVFLFLCSPVFGQLANFDFNPNSITAGESDVFDVDVEVDIGTAFAGDVIWGYSVAVEMVGVELVNLLPNSSLSADTAFFSVEIHTAAATGNNVLFAALISDYGFMFSGPTYDGSTGTKTILDGAFVGLATTTTATLTMEQSFGNAVNSFIGLNQTIIASSTGTGTGNLVEYYPNANPAECTVTITTAEQDFKRGDANGDSGINIADAITMLNVLFPTSTNMTVIECTDSADVNDDGDTNIADPIALLAYLFGSGSAPPSPFASCGTDSTSDSLDCDKGPCP